MKRTGGTGRVALALASVLIIVGMLSTACGFVVNKVAVRAVARGAPAAAPFFSQALRLGGDIAVGEALSRFGGEKKGNQPGLYGGTRDAAHCDKDRLVAFLGKPENRRKAEEWARVSGLDGPGEIAGYVKKLTPVLLRGDTLVKNHEFKKGKAVPFEALLEAGIAILVDHLGRPAVQCSCGNPLSAFDHDIGAADVEFDRRNKKWASYDSKKVSKVEPAPKDKPVEVYALVDVEEPDDGLARPAGSDGTSDTVLEEAPVESSSSSSPTAGTGVPDVVGASAEEARRILEEAGLTVGPVQEVFDPAAAGTVLAQSPAAGEEAPGDGVVTLTVATATSPTADPSASGEPVGETTEDTTGDTTGGAGAVGGVGDPGGGTAEPGASGTEGAPDGSDAV
ncbi:PASTA domain-containing protein [Streptomyces sp. NPDC052012]|uniref:PASTA domain-containing protein n=1 Tax=Streptomyces sp. NPDC052012 TaxID=3155051 RepID=UPI00344BA461